QRLRATGDPLAQRSDSGGWFTEIFASKSPKEIGESVIRFQLRRALSVRDALSKPLCGRSRAGRLLPFLLGPSEQRQGESVVSLAAVGIELKTFAQQRQSMF